MTWKSKIIILTHKMCNIHCIDFEGLKAGLIDETMALLGQENRGVEYACRMFYSLLSSVETGENGNCEFVDR